MSRAGFPRLRKNDPKQQILCSSIGSSWKPVIAAGQKGDENLYYLDGAGMFGNEDQDTCTVDHTLPNYLGFYWMGQHIRPVLYNMLNGIK